ncbi:hypothetical protein AX14_007148 [Amanita brunnescens Koide BX004]|nr:hypothetical protein AX14_007148 [Amanita brunnescens Koide BX004]
MPRMLFSYALLCFALAGSSATQTDSHRDTKPVIAHGTNQKPVPPQPDYGPGILHHAAFNPNLGIERTDAIVNNDDLKTADKNDPVEGRLYLVRRKAIVSHDYASSNSRELIIVTR